MCARHPQVHYSSPCRTFVAKRKTATIKTSANNHKTKKKLTQHQNDSLRRTPVRTPMNESQIGENLFLHIALPHVPHVCAVVIFFLSIYIPSLSLDQSSSGREMNQEGAFGGKGARKNGKQNAWNVCCVFPLYPVLGPADIWIWCEISAV